MDLITDLGYLALASRLKRLGDRLQEAVSEIYSEQNLGFRARWFARYGMPCASSASRPSGSGLGS